MHNFTQVIKEIGRGRDGSRNLSDDQAFELMSAILDGGVPDLELGAILIAMRMKSEADSELRGFYRAIDSRLNRLKSPISDCTPIVIPSYNGARKEANLTPLLALLLRKMGIPVLIHGFIDGNGRISTATVLRELGILPVSSLERAQEALNTDGMAFVPTGVLAPGLAELLSLRAKIGVRNSGHTLVKMINPFSEAALTLVSFSHPDYQAKLQRFYSEIQNTALLFRATEGEPFANPKRRPLLELWRGGQNETLFEAEAGVIQHLPNLPDSLDPSDTAQWTLEVLAGHIPVPTPIVHQVAACLYGCGKARTLNEAKALASLETSGLTPIT